MKPIFTSPTRFLSLKTAACALALTGSILLPAQIAHAQSIGVQLNGNSVNFSEASPVNISGSVLVPMRGVFEAMNANVRYAAPTRTITAGRGNREIILTIGSATAYVNGSPITLSQPARVINGSTFVPLRFVADALGANVRWESASRTVIIQDGALTGGGDMGGGMTPNPGTGNVPTTGIGNVPLPTNPINPNPVTPTVPTTGTTAAEGITAVFERVDTAPPASMVLLVNGQNKRYDMAANVDVYTQVGNGTSFGPLVPIDPTNLRPGEDVQVVMNEGMVTRVTAKRVVRAGRVLSSTGNRIVLTDGTQLNIGPRLRYTNPQGENTGEANLAANSTVALFVRQNTGAIYGISSTPADVAAASNLGVTTTTPGTTTPTNTVTNPGANTMGAITMVKHSAAAPLTTNGTINVEVRGTPGLRGTFSLSQKLSNLPLSEGPAGLYRGNYSVKTGDDVLNSFVTARLSGTANGANVDETQQSEAPLTIDTVAPRIVSIEPAIGGTIGETRPTLVVTVDDVGGSGLAKARYELSDAAGKRPIAPMTVVPPNRATVVVDNLAGGRVSGRVGVSDAAGNELLTPFSFTVQPRQGAITSVTQDSTRPLRLNDVITVDVQAQPGGRATFDLVAPNNQVVANNVPMTEINAGTGRYRGTYNFNALPTSDQVRVRARFDNLNGGIDTLDAQTPVMLANVAMANQAFSITAPAQNSAAGNAVTVNGRGTPGALVDVTITAQGVRTLFGIIGYQQFSQTVDTKQVQVDNGGNWTTPAFALEAPRGIAQLKYEISAVQTDAGNQKSQPKTVTLNTQ